jgi:hypothetical protein
MLYDIYAAINTAKNTREMADRNAARNAKNRKDPEHPSYDPLLIAETGE